MSTTIKIAITDDHPMILEGFRTIFQEYLNYSIYQFTRGDQTLEYLETHNLDVLFLDINLPDYNGIELCAKIKQKYPNIILIGFSNHTEQSLILKFIQNGGNGYVLKNAGREEIIKQLNKAFDGELAFCSESLKIITTASNQEEPPRLTKRETQILKAIADAHTSAEIAAMLFISLVTVETHRRNLLQKFKAKNTVDLIRKAIEYQMI